MSLSAWLPSRTIGGPSGNAFEIFAGKSGKFVKTISVYDGSDGLVGIIVTWTDDTKSPQIGRAVGSPGSITLTEGETITNASLWANRAGTRTGRIELTTSKGQSLKRGTNFTASNVFTIDVGSGHLGGFSGHHGWEIDNLSFIFLRPISKVEIINVQYAALPPNSNITTSILSQTTQESKSKDDIEWHVANSVEKTDSVVWELLAFDRFGVTVRVIAGIPGIVSENDSFHWEVGPPRSWERSESHSSRHGWEIKGILKPGQKILATSTIQVGAADVLFESNVTISLNNNASLSYPESGKLRITLYQHPRGSYVDITGKDFH